MAARLPLIAGNWKMNLNHLEAIGLVQKIAFSLPEKYFAKVEVAVLPPFVDIRSIQTLVDGDKLLIKYGAQDISQHDSGAYTGEVSGPMLKKLACHYVVVGHSERREYHGETDAIVNAKVKAALKHEVTPIFCFGEKLDVREAKGHLELVRQQLEDGLKGFSAEQVAKIVFAYEPVWAIGTGKTASSADAQEVCSAVRSFVAEKYGEETAAVVRVLYGGSVKSSNIGELIQQKDIDGALVGGASLQADEFTKLCALAAGGPLP